MHLLGLWRVSFHHRDKIGALTHEGFVFINVE